MLSIVTIPKQILLSHWQKFAKAVLPYLKGRPVTLEQVFDGKVIWRRYDPIAKPKKQLIYINSEEDVLKWAYRHTYAFHPYVCYPKQKAKCWYVLDIDPTLTVDFEFTKKLALFVYNFLTTNNIVKGFISNLIIKFCGKNGFHFIADLNIEDNVTGQKRQTLVFELNQRISLLLAQHIAKEFWDLAQDIVFDLTSKEEKQLFRDFLQTAGLKQHYKRLQELDALPHDKLKTQKIIYLDTRIFHRFANIRSPYSIHPQTGYYSVVLAPEEIERFEFKWARVESDA